ncbi:MAG: right-handed parallel beta-helix repeat-containing protein [Bacteroidota bacterium]
MTTRLFFPSSVRKSFSRLFALLVTFPALILAQSTYYVAVTGDDLNPGTEVQPWKTIQKACNTLTPGSTAFIKAGTYNEKVTVNVSGHAGGFITITNYPGDTVIVDGTGRPGQNIIYIENKNYLKISGLTLRNNVGVTDGSGIRIEGYADHIELRDNTIHAMRGTNAMGITCYGTSGSASISNIIIDGNTIFDCDASPSEALVLNGNVDGFEVTNNLVYDINNIGIDFIGGEGTCPVGSKDRARNGVCRRNRVYNARSNSGGGYAAGIYVDGGRKIVVENNIVYENDLGIEIGCENHGETTDSVIVRNNLVYNNDKRGISFGGYNYPSTGQVRYCWFLNNTLFKNDVLSTGDGEFLIEYARNCVIKNNIVYGTAQNILLSTTVGTVNQNVLDHNLWFADAGIDAATFVWDGVPLTGFSQYRSTTGQDMYSIFSNPLFVATTLPQPDLHVAVSSPAIEIGDPAFIAGLNEEDVDGEPRLIGARVDIGADEASIVPGIPLLVSPPDGEADQAQFTMLVWESTGGTSSYHLQVALDSLFNIPAVDDSMVYNDSQIVGPLLSGTQYWWRTRGRNIIATSAWSEVRRFTTAAFVTNSFLVDAGWNMVSLPLSVFDGRISRVYPAAVSNAYRFVPLLGYVVEDTLQPGSGYWVKFSVPQSVSVTGAIIDTDTVAITAGWNMIGSISHAIDTGNVVQTPPGILQSAYYGYDGSYFVSDSLHPGESYWVKAFVEGVLIFPSPVSRSFHSSRK